jgi:Predicted transporter component
MALVGRGHSHRPHGACPAHFGQQTLRPFGQPAPRLRGLFPSQPQLFQVRLEKESWNLFFVGGIVLGAVIASTLLANPEPVKVAPELAAELEGYGITDYSNMVPAQLISWDSLLTWRGFVMLVLGGFLVGFGSRYAGGCTSGHAIMGLSNLQWPSLVATICFMAGGFLMANLILPHILAL